MCSIYEKSVKYIFNKKDYIMKVGICFIVLLSVLGGCSYLNSKIGLEDDNFFEESLEEVIETKTGIDIDLSPSSKE
jgi:hypothetical protein